MIEWQALEGMGGVATAIALVVAVVFGIAQVRQVGRQRRDAVAMQIISEMLTPEFLKALDRVLSLPEDVSPVHIRGDEPLRAAVMQLDFAFETTGAMVHDGILPLHFVDRIMGGVIRLSWRRAAAYTETERERMGSPAMGEWWQWLVERMEEDPAPGRKEGAHVAFRAWRSKRGN